MKILLLFLVGAILSACGCIQWYKGIEANWNLDWPKIRQSFIAFAFALFFGITLFFMLENWLWTQLQIQQNFAFLVYWIFFMLASVQLFYEMIIQKIQKFAEAYIKKLLK